MSTRGSPTSNVLANQVHHVTHRGDFWRSVDAVMPWEFPKQHLEMARELLENLDDLWNLPNLGNCPRNTCFVENYPTHFSDDLCHVQLKQHCVNLHWKWRLVGVTKPK